MTQIALTQPQTLAQASIPQVDQDRKRQMREAWKAFHGEYPNPLKIDANQPDDNVLPNPCETIVAKGVSYLCNKSVKIEAVDEKKTGGQDTPIQNFLDGLWGDDDDKMTFLTKVSMNGGVCGQAFVKLIPAQRGMRYPRIVNLDPLLVRMVVDPEDCDIVLAFVIEYPISNGMQKRQIIARVDPGGSVELWGENDPQDTWTVTNYQKPAMGNQQSTWQQVGISDPWPYPFPPIFTNQNLPNPNEGWGISDLTKNIIDLTKAYQFALTNISRILKYHAHPKTIARGVRADQIEVAINEVLCLPSPDSDMRNLEMTSNLQSSRDHASDIRMNINVQSRVPAIAQGLEDPKGNVSGVALTVYYQPILEKTTEKQRLYGKMVREVSRAALVLAGLIPVEQYEDYKIELHWQPLLPTDDLAAGQLALILQQLGVSLSTILQGLNLDPEDEASKKLVETAQQLTAFSRGQGMPPPAQPVPPPESPFIGSGQAGGQQQP